MGGWVGWVEGGDLFYGKLSFLGGPGLRYHLPNQGVNSAAASSPSNSLEKLSHQQLALDRGP